MAGEQMRHFMFLLSLPLETVQRIEQTQGQAGKLVRVRRIIQANRTAILRSLEEAVLEQVENPRELAELHVAPGSRAATVRTRMKRSVEELPE